MSLPLKELRLYITPETHVWLAVRSEQTGQDRNEIAREILHQYVARQVHEATVLVRALQSSGLQGTVKESDRGNPE